MALKRKLAILVATPIALLAIVWLAAPFAGRAAMRRGMRDLRRNEGLDGRFADVRHDGAGLALTGVAITTTSGEPVASAGSLSIRPAFAWPPARIHLEHAVVTQRGLDTWSCGFAGANASWYRKTALTISRNYGVLPGAQVFAELDDVFIERGAGAFGTKHGIATLRLPSTTRLEFTFDGDYSSRGPCGGGSVFAIANTVVEVVQDSLEVRLAGELATLNPSCKNCPVGDFAATVRVPAPGWAAVIGTNSTWSGPAGPKCLLGF